MALQSTPEQTEAMYSQTPQWKKNTLPKLQSWLQILMWNQLARPIKLCCYKCSVGFNYTLKTLLMARGSEMQNNCLCSAFTATFLWFKHVTDFNSTSGFYLILRVQCELQFIKEVSDVKCWSKKIPRLQLQSQRRDCSCLSFWGELETEFIIW